MNNRNGLALAFLALLAVGSVAASRADLSEPAKLRLALRALPVDFAEDADCTTCGNCPNETDKHQIVGSSGPDRRYLEVDHSCSTNSSGKCADQHPESEFVCGGEPCECENPPCEPCGEAELAIAKVPLLDTDAKERLWKLVLADGAVDDLRTELAAFGPRVVYNANRHAIQVLGCRASVALSIPVTPAQAVGLSP